MEFVVLMGFISFVSLCAIAWILFYMHQEKKRSSESAQQ